MKVILRLALKNLREHKAKTAIIASFITIGCALVILGNAFLENVNRGLEKDFRANHTGDVVIAPYTDNGEWYHLFGVEGHPWDGHIPQTPALPSIEEVEEIVAGNHKIKEFTKVVTTKVFMLQQGKDVNLTDFLDSDNLSVSSLPIAFIFAGDEDYFDVFSGITILEGTYPAEGKDEVLIDTQLKAGYEKNYKTALHTGDRVLILGANTDGVVREATVCGIYTPTNKNSAMFQTMYSSASFARPFCDLTVASRFETQEADNILPVFTDLSEDDLFGAEGDDFFSIEEDDSILSDGENIDYFNLLGDTSLRDELNKSDNGSWNFIITKIDNPEDDVEVIEDLNRSFTEHNIMARAIDWKTAATTYTTTVEGINVIFNIMIVILAIVVFFIIMNTMTVSVVERTGEIGTMRAIGAEKSFVRSLFFVESMIITVFSAIAGAVVAGLISLIINSLGIDIDNSMAKVILGGGAVHFSITPVIVIVTIIAATIGSILSNIYPVSSALKVSPLKALSKGSE